MIPGAGGVKRQTGFSIQYSTFYHEYLSILIGFADLYCFCIDLFFIFILKVYGTYHLLKDKLTFFLFPKLRIRKDI